MHPYDQSYLQEIVETQGSLFERLQDVAPTADGLEFVRSYMKSDTRAFIDRGDVYLATIGPKGPLWPSAREVQILRSSGTVLRAPDLQATAMQPW